MHINGTIQTTHLDSAHDAEREAGRLEDDEELEELHDEGDGASHRDEAGEAADLAQVVEPESLLGRGQLPTYDEVAIQIKAMIPGSKFTF